MANQAKNTPLNNEVTVSYNAAGNLILESNGKKRKYIGYTKESAIKHFNNYLNKLNNMKTKIEISVPTSYQSSSIYAFGIEVKQQLNGSLTASKEFESKKEAKEYLKKVVTHHYNNGRYFDTIKAYKSALASIRGGSLTIDAATAYIENVNNS